LEKVGLTGKESEKANLLSKGEAERLGLARLCLQNRKIILLDEPDANLDILCQEKIAVLIRNLSRTKIVIIASHSVPQGKDFADVIISYRPDKALVCSTDQDLMVDSTTIPASSAPKEKQSSLPFPIFKKLLGCLFSSTAKRFAVFFPILIVLNCFVLFSSLFSANTGSSFVYDHLNACGINGVLTQEKEKGSVQTATPFSLTFVGDDESSFSVYNDDDSLALPSANLVITMPNSIILPSGMCQKRNWKTGDNVSVIVSGRTLILSIEKIYPESTVTEETLEKDSLFSKTTSQARQNLLLCNNPILVPRAVGLLSQGDSNSLGYCSSLFFKNSTSLASGPLFLTDSKGDSTLIFWKSKLASSNLYFSFVWGGIVLSLASYFLFLTGVKDSWSSTQLFFRLSDGSFKRGNLVFLSYIAIFQALAILGSILLYFALAPALNHSLIAFYKIEEIIPLFVFSWQTVFIFSVTQLGLIFLTVFFLAIRNKIDMKRL
jgi:hypothetical protein